MIRKVVNLTNYAVGLIAEKALLEDLLELPINKQDAEHTAFRKRVDNLKVKMERTRKAPKSVKGTVKKESAEVSQKSVKVFDPDAVDIIMGRYAGTFRREAEVLGLEIIDVLSPSIELPEGVELAAERKQVQEEENRVLASKMGTIRNEAKKTADDLDILGTDALDRVGLAAGQNISRTIIGLPGVPEAIEKGAKALIKGLTGNDS